MVLLFLGLTFPGILVAISPRKWIRAAAGWALLFAGLLAVDLKTATASPFDDDGAGFGAAVAIAFVIWWLVSLGLALLIRHRALIEGPPEAGTSVTLRWLMDWALPLALLVAAAFLHWLSNRIAGTAPAWLVHIGLIVAAGGLAAAVLWRAGWHFADLGPRGRMAFAVPAAFAALIVWDAAVGFQMWARARSFAGQRPFCTMTYGGFQHRRQARSGWDLSPLVDRHYGSWAVSKTRFLVIGTGADAKMYRWFDNGFRDVTHGTPECSVS